MSEKFEDMLPLNEKRMEFLKNDKNDKKCDVCFLSSENRNKHTLCGDLVRGKTWVFFTCTEVRAEAIRLHEKYRRKT